LPSNSSVPAPRSCWPAMVLMSVDLPAPLCEVLLLVHGPASLGTVIT
jgi:hypothetical protein